MTFRDWWQRLVGGARDPGSDGDREDPDPGPIDEDDDGDDGADLDAMPEVVELTITDELDLHAFHPRDVKDLVDGYLHEARTAGFGEVRVIHGKGKGVQRDIVHALCDHHPAVAAYRLAGGRSGWGATLITLRPPDEE